MLALLNGISLSALPMILIWVLIIALFLWLLFFILSKMPEPMAGWARTIVIVVAGILLLWFLISMVSGGGFPLH